MKTRLITPSLTFVFTILLIAASAHADDAAIKKQLVSSWKGPDNQIIVLKPNGAMTSSDTPALKQSWDVRDGIFHTTLSREDSFKIISLTKTKFVIQDMYHGRHTGTWTRIAAPLAPAPDADPAHGSDSPAGDRSSQEQLIYNLYQSFAAERLWFHRQELGKFLRSGLIRDMVKAEEADLYLELGCPFVPGNDVSFEEVGRTVEVKQLTPGTVLATFTNGGTRHEIRYALEREKGQWRVADIFQETGGGTQSFARDLAKSLSRR